MNLEGRLLGNRYEILENIGNGGMATVYKAKCHVLNRFVAVKVLRDEFTTDEEFVKRFNTEAQSAASLTHPNIVSVYDVGSEGNIHYIVMELIKGKTLKEIINEDGALSWKWSLNVAIQIASALETAHKNNIIHRDIKPHNIIITEDGIAKVTDFGIAKAVSNSTITAFGTTIGSVHYFSPEHARGGFTDAKSDLYSLGVVLYEMVTGKVPFNADTPVSVALKHMQEKPIEPMKVNPNVPKAVNDIIMKAMQKDVNLRYQNATEMLRDLSKALKNPNEDFVVSEKTTDFPTQRISTIYTETPKREARNDENKEEEEKSKNKFTAFIKKHKALSIVIGSILLFVITILVTNLILGLVTKKDVQIPDLVGKEQTIAQSEVEGLKLKYEKGSEEYNKDIPAGYIISQDPTYMPNYKIKEGSTITVVVSLGSNTVKMEKVVGLTQEEAKSKLEALGLKVSIEEVYDNKVEAGYVVEQSVKENEEIDAGETINLKVSKGIEKVTVPDLLGKTEDEAKTAIKDAGLKLKTVASTEDTTKDDGVVVKQSLEAGTEVDKNSTITITVNKLREKKKTLVVINVQSLLEGTELAEKEKVTVTISVNGTDYNVDRVSPKLSSVTKEITGVGTATIQVKINNTVYGSSQTITYGDTCKFE